MAYVQWIGVAKTALRRHLAWLRTKNGDPTKRLEEIDATVAALATAMAYDPVRTTEQNLEFRRRNVGKAARIALIYTWDAAEPPLGGTVCIVDVAHSKQKHVFPTGVRARAIRIDVDALRDKP